MSGGLSTSLKAHGATELAQHIGAAETADALKSNVSDAVDLWHKARVATHPYLENSEMIAPCFNEAYAYTSVRWAAASLRAAPNDHEVAAAAVRAVDLAILRGGFGWSRRASTVLESAANVLQPAYVQESNSASERRAAEVEGHPVKRHRTELYQSSSDREAARCAAEQASPHWKSGSRAPEVQEIPRIASHELR